MELGIVVIDPETDTVLTEATDLRHVHPLKHAAMVAIDNIAALQGGGAWVTKTIGNIKMKKIFFSTP